MGCSLETYARPPVPTTLNWSKAGCPELSHKVARTLQVSVRRVHMKLGFFCFATLLAAGLATAQDAKSKSRVIVEDGKEMTVTGCVQKNADGGFTLTNVAGKNGYEASYILAQFRDKDEELEDISDHVGHRLEITGKAANRGDGKIRLETTSEVKKAGGGTAKTETKSEMKGDLDGLPFLGVGDARMIAKVCP